MGREGANSSHRPAIVALLKRGVCGMSSSIASRSKGKDQLGRFLFAVIIPIFLSACGQEMPRSAPNLEGNLAEMIFLPEPALSGSLSLEECLEKRRSARQFTDNALDLGHISQLLWAAQGITDPRGYRSAPSAGALYPLEVYAVLPEGVYSYQPSQHAIRLIIEGDLRAELSAAALQQAAVLEAPMTMVIAAVYTRTSQKYGSQRSQRYVHMEAGHAAQNVLLQAVSLQLGAVPIGAFEDRGVQSVLQLPKDHEPLYLIPIGAVR